MVNGLINRVCRINIWYLDPDIMIQCEYILDVYLISCKTGYLIFNSYYQIKYSVVYCSVIQACKTVKFLYMKNFLLISCVHKLIYVNKNFNQKLDIMTADLIWKTPWFIYYFIGLRFTKKITTYNQIYKCSLYGLSCYQ